MGVEAKSVREAREEGLGLEMKGKKYGQLKHEGNGGWRTKG